MAHSWIHAKSSARRFGGKPEDYIAIHDWFDGTKELEPTFRHRALRHHTHGIFEAERLFGHVIINSDGKEVPVRVIGEQHVKEDFGGFIPTPHDWLKSIPMEKWMQPSPAYQRELEASLAADFTRETTTPDNL
jgi:hypothetical protein